MLSEHIGCSILLKLFGFFGKNLTFPILNNCKKLKPVHATTDCPVTESKPTLQNLRSSQNADYEGVNNQVAVNPFQKKCHTNNNKVCEELDPYFDQMTELYVPRRTRLRQYLAPWIIGRTSSHLKQLKMQKYLLERKPARYQNQQIQNLENLVTDSSDGARNEYQEKLLSARNFDALFQHLNCLNESPAYRISSSAATSAAQISMSKFTC